MVKVMHLRCVGDSLALCKHRNSCLIQPTASAVSNIESMVTIGINPNIILKLLLHRLFPTTKNGFDIIWRQLYTDWKKKVLKVSNPFNKQYAIVLYNTVIVDKGIWNFWHIFLAISV